MSQLNNSLGDSYVVLEALVRSIDHNRSKSVSDSSLDVFQSGMIQMDNTRDLGVIRCFDYLLDKCITLEF